MASNYQLVPFPVPDYLAQFLATKLNTHIVQEKGIFTIQVERRYQEFGKMILRSLVTDNRRRAKKTDQVIFLKISNFAGDHYNDTPDGSRYFLKFEEAKFIALRDHLKRSFEDSLYYYVQGAEYAHQHNGWTPDQKRKGIRKHAILEFCEKNNVSPNKRSLDSLVKMIQRRNETAYNQHNKVLQNLSEVLSF